MADKENHKIWGTSSSRRIFLKRLGAATAGVLVAPYLKQSGVFAYEYKNTSSSLAQVALTQTLNTPADSYDPVSVKAKVQYLFETLGGIGDVVKKGNKVAIKINLTGGSGNATSSMLNGLSITDTMWTHPAVLQAVGELLIDAGVNGSDIYIVDSLWDTGPTAPFGANDSFGYAAVQKTLGSTWWI